MYVNYCQRKIVSQCWKTSFEFKPKQEPMDLKTSCWRKDKSRNESSIVYRVSRSLWKTAEILLEIGNKRNYKLSFNPKGKFPGYRYRSFCGEEQILTAQLELTSMASAWYIPDWPIYLKLTLSYQVMQTAKMAALRWESPPKSDMDLYS